MAPNSINIQDFDAHKSYIMIDNIVRPVEIAYMMTENKLFWVDEKNELYYIGINYSNKTKLLSMRQNVRCLAIDWLERCLYYVQNDLIGKGSSVYKLNLNEKEVFEGMGRINHVVSTSGVIKNLKVSPFTR